MTNETTINYAVHPPMQQVKRPNPTTCTDCDRRVFHCRSTATGYRHAPMTEPDGQPDCEHKPPRNVKKEEK
jgi:hypothetical protein